MKCKVPHPRFEHKVNVSDTNALEAHSHLSVPSVKRSRKYQQKP